MLKAVRVADEVAPEVLIVRTTSNTPPPSASPLVNVYVTPPEEIVSALAVPAKPIETAASSAVNIRTFFIILLSSDAHYNWDVATPCNPSARIAPLRPVLQSPILL